MQQFMYGLTVGLIVGWIALECWKWKERNKWKQLHKH